MRDAFGGVFMTTLFLVFIFIFVAFTAISLNYAKAFRVKNSVIDFIEQAEIQSLDKSFSKTGSKDLSKLDSILTDAGYYKECSTTEKISVNGSNGYCYKGIIVLEDRVETSSNQTHETAYYKVLTYADWNLGALNKILVFSSEKKDSSEIVNGTWEIVGEAKVVRKKK